MFDDNCYKYNETLLRFLGIWPHERTQCERFRAICIYMLLMSHAIAELAQLIVADLSINITIKILSDALTALLQFLIFNTLFLNTTKLKQMLEELINNRRMLTDSQEIKILESYAHQGEKFIIIIILEAYIISLFLI
ncbi:uncharacterized protein LOC120358458 [Solenopsis invicta]|uniref:uncharacterized protein LOC120358458 n=1 Tax=Solenopsis invicta TaxID=13686 RepID=UPI00193CAFAA|nr:uncharacterized protein LOC120358458 [Solenopsis invicta]